MICQTLEISCKGLVETVVIGFPFNQDGPCHMVELHKAFLFKAQAKSIHEGRPLDKAHRQPIGPKQIEKIRKHISTPRVSSLPSFLEVRR